MTDQNIEIWKAGYDLHEKYGEGPKTDAEWMALAEDCKALYNRYAGALFAVSMGMMVMDYYEAKQSIAQQEAYEQTKIRM